MSGGGSSNARGDRRAQLSCPPSYDFDRTMAGALSGRGDPTATHRPGIFWKATRSPEGPVLVALRRTAEGIDVHTWGPGCDWALDWAPALAGLHDDPNAFDPQDEPMRSWARKARGVHLPQTRAIYERLVPVILQQLVTGKESARALMGIVRGWGEDAPGPPGLRLLPTPEVMAGVAYHDLTPRGVLRKQAVAIRGVAREGARLERLLAGPPEDALAYLQRLRGIGPWTANLVVAATMGWPDAVPVGDYHYPNDVCYALAGEPKGTDERMLELLEPYRGHRWRAAHVATRHGPRRERRGHRLAVRPLPTED